MDTDVPCAVNLEELSEVVASVLLYKKQPLENDDCSSTRPVLQKMDNAICQAENMFLGFKIDQLTTENKASYWYLLGRMYNCSQNFRFKALDALGKAVKLDPINIEAWNELGECYWYTENPVLAKRCFESALKQKKNKVSLRNLSIALRKEAIREKQNITELIEKGITFAKDAVEQDPKDGVSWTILGNSYLSAFFAIRQKQLYAVQAIAAYKQAEKTANIDENPELYYNKGVALKYTEQYGEALEALYKAVHTENNWELPRTVYDDLIKYLEQIVHLITNKGKLRPKRLNIMRKDLACKLSLGPYIIRAYNIIYARDLKVGDNRNYVLFGKVIWSLQLNDTFPFTVGLMDGNGDIVVLTIFNILSGKGFLIGDSVAVPDPTLIEVKVNHQGKNLQFRKVRINYPPKIVVNNKLLSNSCYRKMRFDTTEV